MADSNRENKKVNIKAIIIAVVALISVILLLNFADTDSLYPDEKSYMGFPVQFTSNDIIDVKSMKNDLFVLTKKYVTCLKNSGESKYDFSFTFSEPAIFTNDNYGVVFDTMSDKYIVFGRKNIIREGKTEDGKYIYLAEVTEKGELVLVTKSSDSACKLYLYDKKAEKKFVWSCGDEYIVSTDVSSNGKKIICGTIGSYNSEIYSKIYVFDISSETPEREYVIPRSSCIDVELSGKMAVVTCNDKRLVYDITNDDEIQVQFNSKALFYATDDDLNTAIITDAPENENGEYRLSLYNKKNELLYAVTFDGNVEDILCDSECVYILDNTAVRQFAKNAEEKSSLSHSKRCIGVVKAGGSIYCYYLGGVEKAVV